VRTIFDISIRDKLYFLSVVGWRPPIGELARQRSSWATYVEFLDDYRDAREVMKQVHNMECSFAERLLLLVDGTTGKADVEALGAALFSGRLAPDHRSQRS
jgi:hypothetical protein